jgi:importin subunit beta-1
MTDPAQIQQLAQLLLAAQQSNPDAEKQLNAFKDSNLGNYFQGLVSVLATDGINTDPLARQLAGLLIKNALKPLHSTEHALQTQYHDQWKALDPAIRDSVKGPLLMAMRNQVAAISHPAAQAAAEVAAVELPYEQWPAFLPTLLENIRGVEYGESIKVATLECLGYCCERISFLGGVVNQTSTDSMLSAIVDGISAARPNRMRQAAAGALKNSLMFAESNMEKQEERGAIMTALMEATRCDDANVRIVAYDGIVQIAVLYYAKLQEYMTNLYQLTTNTIKQDSEEVAKAAIEFWTSLCEVEQDLIDEEAEMRQRGLPTERPCMRYVDAAMQHLAPFLFETLTKQDEDPDNDDFTLQMAGQLCLTSVSQTVEDSIVPVVMPFVNANIQDTNWRNRDAAIMAFISILDGPSAEIIGPYVSQSVQPMLNMLNDDNIIVRDSAAHCISRICLLHVQYIPVETFQTLLKELTTKCSDGSPKVASQAATAIFNLASAFSDQSQDDDQPTNALSQYMQVLLEKLLQMVDRPDANDDANLRLAGMEAISELISVSAQDNLQILAALLPNFISRFDQTQSMSVLNEEEKHDKEQVQGLLCAVIQNLYRKLDKATVLPYTDQVMTLLLQVLSVKNSSCHEECFTAISAISDAIESDFAKYMAAVEPCLVAGLRNFQAYQVCIVAVGTVGDISRNIEEKIQPHCDNIMNALVDDLKDSNIHRSVKPPVLSCFGDIAMAIGGAYKPYLEFSVLMLMQASATTVPEEDEDLIEYLNMLRESILEAYVGIIQGLRDGNLLGDFITYVPSILQFLQKIAEDPNRDSYVLNKAVGLLGDLAQTMGPQIKDELNKQFASKLVSDAMSSGDSSLVEVATWASQLLTQAVQMS